MKLYNEYCYSDLATVADVVRSNQIMGDGSIINTVVVNVNGTDLDITTDLPKSFTITPPDCTQLGFNKTWLGISFADSQELSWLIAFVLISAFAIKVLKRGL